MTQSTWLVIDQKERWAVGRDHLVALQSLFRQTGEIPDRYLLFQVDGETSPLYSQHTKTIITRAGATITEHGVHAKTKEGYKKI